MPLLNASDLAIPGKHGRCAPPGDACVQCRARYWLADGDWDVINFYHTVSDQVVNLTNGPTEDGKSYLAPRLEGWLAACELHGIPAEQRSDLVDVARTLFSGVHGHIWVKGLHQLNPKLLAPPELS